MKILTAAQMRSIDRKAIEEIGLPGVVLMENAGLEIVRAVAALYPDLAGERIVIVAGKGNNGGDGLVVARHLRNRGAKPKVLLLAARDEVKGDAAVNLAAASRMGVEIVEIPGPEAWAGRGKDLARASIIVDAIFGTGLEKPAAGLQAAAIADINRARGFKVAVDLPSGLSSDTPRLIGPAVRADLTVCLAALKICHVLPPAEELCGDILIGDIGAPPALFEDPALSLELTEGGEVLAAFGRRPRDSHKGTYGHLLVVAGSIGKTGAAVMAGKAALRTGAGLVTIATPRSCVRTIARSMDELMTEPLEETPAGTIAASAVGRVLDLAGGKDAVLLGPGLSTDPSTAAFVRGLLPKLEPPVIVDADGLNNLAGSSDLLENVARPAVLTPHPGEFSRLTGLPTREILDRRLDLAGEFARARGVVLVLKGYRTLVAAPDGRIHVNPTGNPGMASGGTGDVLGGMVGSLLVQTKDPLRAAVAGVYLHGLCGDLAAEKLGERALVAGDLLRYLPKAEKSLEDEAAGGEA